MKTIGIYNYNSQLYTDLIERLKQHGIQIMPLKSGQVGEEIDLYAFDVDTSEEFEAIQFDRPFIVISSLQGAKFLMKSKSLGALDYISKPFIDLTLTVKRLQRLLEKDHTNDSVVSSAQTEKYNRVIDVEIKRAHRGKYPLSLASVKFETRMNREAMIRVIDKIKTVLRDSDSCIPYSDNNIVIILPFADKPGSVVVARKIIDILNSLNCKSYCLCSEYPEDGETREELMRCLGKSVDTRELFK